MSTPPQDPFDPKTWNQQPVQNNPNGNSQNPFSQQSPQQNPFQIPGGFQPHGSFPGGMPIDLPSSGSAQLCGIIGLVLFWNVIGIILNIVAIVNGARGINEFAKYPGRYTEDSLRRAKTGKICGIVGVSLFVVFILALIIILAVAVNS